MSNLSGTTPRVEESAPNDTDSGSGGKADWMTFPDLEDEEAITFRRQL